jgi:hypothetical protein
MLSEGILYTKNSIIKHYALRIKNYFTIIPRSHFSIQEAFASSLSIWKSSAASSLTLTFTWSKTSSLGPGIFILTIWLWWTHKSLASGIVQCKCLWATITPWETKTSHWGPTRVRLPLSWIFPDTRTGASHPRIKVSHLKSSTCVHFLVGHIILTFSILPWGQTRVSVSLQENFPGCDRGLSCWSWYPLPKSFSISIWERWICLLEIHIGILMEGEL